MKILNWGSLNVDHVYEVTRFVEAGETVAVSSYARRPGGKGLNQSVALARAGVQVWHAGVIGADGGWLKDGLSQAGVNVSLVMMTTEFPTGHAVIQVRDDGENGILVCAGANEFVSQADIPQMLEPFGAGDWLLLQNEIGAVAAILRAAKRRGMRVAFNPAPMTARVRGYPLDHVDMLFLNETEAEALTGEIEEMAMLAALRLAFPDAVIVLTLGARGAYLVSRQHGSLHCPAERVKAVDTTGAGDAFIGFFLAGYVQGAKPEWCLKRASLAASLCVQRVGASESIPSVAEVEALLKG